MPAYSNPCYFAELSKEVGLKINKPGRNILSFTQLASFKEKYQQWS